MIKRPSRFRDIGIGNFKFHCSKYPIDKVNIEKIVISKTFYSIKKVFKYFIGLKCGNKLNYYV